MVLAVCVDVRRGVHAVHGRGVRTDTDVRSVGNTRHHAVQRQARYKSDGQQGV